MAEGKQTFHICSFFDLAMYQITVVTVIVAIICDDLFLSLVSNFFDIVVLLHCLPHYIIC